MNASWMSLLSELTLGDGAGTIRAEVHADGTIPRRNHLRLVVQTYEGQSHRRLGSIQRAVTPDELHAGVSVAVPHLASEDARVVAWVEGGAPNLEHDGLTARPRRGSLVGFGRGEDVCIHLSRRG